MSAPETLAASIETSIRGRILMRPGADVATAFLLGFHGYAESAEIQLERLSGIPGARHWAVVSVQALHRFYRSRTQDTVASWMTRQDREAMIAANLTYVNRVFDWVTQHAGIETPPTVVYAGFSQGAAMAFRAAVRATAKAAGVISVGADVPPELLADPAARFPPVLLARGRHDEWYTQAKFDADVAALEARSVEITPLLFDGGHDWTAEVSAHAGRFLARFR